MAASRGAARVAVRGSFAHLDVRSFFSLKEGAFSPEQLARRAAELGDAGRGAHRPRRALRRRPVREGMRARGGAADPRRLVDRQGTGEGGWGTDGRPRGAARARRRRLREPVPADDRRPPAGRPRRSVGGPRADLRPRGRHGRTARAALARRTARAHRAARRRRAPGRPVPRGVRRRSAARGGRAPPGGTQRRRGPRDAPARRSPGGARGRHERRAVPRARRRVPGRRARVHAPDRPARVEPREPRERRGMAEAARRDA